MQWLPAIKLVLQIFGLEQKFEDWWTKRKNAKLNQTLVDSKVVTKKDWSDAADKGDL